MVKVLKNLDELYLEMNKEILYSEEKEILFKGSSPHKKNVVFTVEKPVVNKLNLKGLGYTEKKLNMLRNKYLDEEQFAKFANDIVEGKVKKAIIYNFKVSKIYAGLPIPNCLLNIVYDKRFNDLTMVWRTTEVVSRLGGDLIFISRLFEQYGLSNIRLNVIFEQCFLFESTALAVYEMLGIKFDVNNIKSEKIKKSLIRFKDLYFPQEGFPGFAKWCPIGLVQREYYDVRDIKWVDMFKDK